MELRITGTNTQVTSAVRRYLERKLGKLNRHFPNILETTVEISEEGTKSPQQHFLVRVSSAAGGARLHGEERGKDLFEAIDKVAAVMTRQLEDRKGKLYERGRGKSLKSEFAEVLEAEATPRVVKVKRFAIRPMTVTEAAEQMELLGHNFFLFLNSDAGEFNLLYRRKDGNYGLIEPETE